MTPAEQDKELREAIVSRLQHAYYNRHTDGIAGVYAHARAILENYTDEIMQLIIADRKRVALEARISELKMWELPENEIQMVFANPCNICGHDYPKLRKAQQDRLSALKAQQEEV